MPTYAEIIADFTAAAAELEAAIAPTPGCALVSSHDWIVLDPYGQPLLFRVEPLEGNKKFTATVIGKVAPHKSNRWERDAAEKLAAVFNGAAVLWQDAAAAKAAEYRGMVADLSRRAIADADTCAATDLAAC